MHRLSELGEETSVTGAVGARTSSTDGELFERAAHGSRAALARLISRAESGNGSPVAVPPELLERQGRAYVIGLTGPPGAGKSTLTDRLVGEIRKTGLDVAVLAIDPTSPYSGGAILGDRVRMGSHALDPHVYIRSLATRGQLGGLSRVVPQALRILEAVGFTVVVIETVGVGQVEIEVASTADTTVVVVNPGWGDSVQANKAGLMEIADVFVINKADRDGVRETRRDLASMLDLGADRLWRPPIVETVASSGGGIADLYQALQDHRSFVERSEEAEAKRRRRRRREFEESLSRYLVERALALPGAEELLERVESDRVDPARVAQELGDRLLSHR